MTTDDADQQVDGPHGPGSAFPRADGSGPDGFGIKAVDDGRTYHTTDSPSWRTVVADAWFSDEEHARAAGFSHWDPYERVDLDPAQPDVSHDDATAATDEPAPPTGGRSPGGEPVGVTGSSATHEHHGDTAIEDRVGSSAAADHVGPYGPGSAEPRADGSGPEGWTVKASDTGTVFHTPESGTFDDVSAHAWFVDVEHARAAGFVHWDPSEREDLSLERVGEGPGGAVGDLAGAVSDVSYGPPGDDDAGADPGPVGGTLEREGGAANPQRTGQEPIGYGALDTHERAPVVDPSPSPDPDADDPDGEPDDGDPDDAEPDDAEPDDAEPDDGDADGSQVDDGPDDTTGTTTGEAGA